MPSATHRPADDDRAVFLLHLIKPSHYDDDGYVIQWVRSRHPVEHARALYGIARDCDGARVLGAGVELRIAVHRRDQLRINPDKIIQAFAAPAARGWWPWSGSNRTSSRARWTSPGRCARREFRCASAGSTPPAAWRCCRSRRPRFATPGTRDIDLRRRGRRASRRGAARRLARRPEAALPVHLRPAQPGRRAAAVSAAVQDHAQSQRAHQLRCRPRLSVSMQLLHDHQRPGTQVALPLGRRRREASCATTAAQGIRISSSPTTISPATATGSRSSTG